MTKEVRIPQNVRFLFIIYRLNNSISIQQERMKYSAYVCMWSYVKEKRGERET